MDEFVALSGRKVKVGEDGSLRFDHGNGYLSPAVAMDAEEYFRAKRDAELGRWRWPLEPTVVVYVDGDNVFVVDERDGARERYSRKLCEATSPPSLRGLHAAAHAYYDAHTVSRPWEDAQPGEVWVLTVPDEGDVDAEIVTVTTAYGTFSAGSMREWSLSDPSIITARRVPTEAAARARSRRRRSSSRASPSHPGPSRSRRRS